MALAELLAVSVACTLFCPPPDVTTGMVNPHENDPFPSVLQGVPKVIATPPSVALTPLFAPKPEPFSVFAEPTVPEVLVSEIEGVIVKLAVAELRKASFASRVFGPTGSTGTVITQENEPLPSERHGPLRGALMPLKFALMSWLAAKPNPFRVVVEPTAPELLANEMEGLIKKFALAVSLESSLACTALCPIGAAGTVKTQENVPFTPLLHELVKVMLAPPRVAEIFWLAAKPVPLSVFDEPTKPEVLVNEMTGVIVKVVVAEVLPASARTVFGPPEVRGTVNAHENE